MIKMTVERIILDPVSNAPIVILKDERETKALPIWVGIFEANAIAMELENVVSPRPMTHDLMKGMLETFNLKVTKVVVDNLVNNTFYATIHVVTPMGEERQIDSRPSDAIALALRMKAPIFVAKDVVERATCIEISKEEDLLKEWLEGLDPEEFEKHKV
jgi:bifunctional DNase/RNase